MIMPIINKLADLQDFNQIGRASIIEKLLKTRYVIEQTGLEYASHMQDDWLRLWEYSGAIIESRLDKRMRVIDVGGSGTIFSFYMALEGCEVHTVDLWEEQVAKAKLISAELGLPMTHSIQDACLLDYPDAYFDAVYCICVLEHIYPTGQLEAIKELTRILKPGGVLSLTFDYGSKAADFPILNKNEVISRFAGPSGLEIMGNSTFHAASNDLAQTTIDYTFGSLFLRKPGELSFANVDRPSVGTPALLDVGDGFSANYHCPRPKGV